MAMFASLNFHCDKHWEEVKSTKTETLKECIVQNARKDWNFWAFEIKLGVNFRERIVWIDEQII